MRTLRRKVLGMNTYELLMAKRVSGILETNLWLNHAFTPFDKVPRAVEQSVRNYNRLSGTNGTCFSPTKIDNFFQE